ncbi:MAG TPA: ABC transporter permease [Planctomycetota bacterium]|nr:ABC transporter permease [Planctomycetota bacterium]
MRHAAWTGLLRALGPFLGLLLIYAFFLLFDWIQSGTADRFLLLFGSGNLKTVAAQTTIVALAALGMTIVIVSAGIDLSPGSSVALTTVVVALSLKSAPGWPSLAILLGIATGAAVGFSNGTLITGLRIVPFIVTLGMMGIVRGVAKFLAGNTTVYPPRTWLNGLLAIDRGPDSPVWKLPWGVVVLAVFALLVHLVLRRSTFGRHVYAIGSNEAAARLCGIQVGVKKVLIYTIAGALTGVAGVLQFSQLTIGDPTGAVGIELNVIASVVIGGGSLNGGKGSVGGTLIGAFLMGVLKNGCDIYGIPNYVQEIFIGLIIIAAVGLDRARDGR